MNSFYLKALGVGLVGSTGVADYWRAEEAVPLAWFCRCSRIVEEKEKAFLYNQSLGWRPRGQN